MESLSSILKHRGTTYTLTELEMPNNLTELEKKILISRGSGLSFCQLDGKDLKHGIDQLILKSAAIVGCQIPQSEYFADILTNEIITFVNEFGYGNLTFDEMLLAIRLNSKGKIKMPSGIDVDVVEFSGNCFNVHWLSKILSNYVVFRNLLDSKILNKLEGY